MEIANGLSPSVSFAVGSHTVTLEVTDDGGARATDTVNVVITAPANIPPTASFTYSCTGLGCTFDGSPSTDPDGTVVGYHWTFGDGKTANGVNVSHTYAAADPYTVRLTVTDDGGATDDELVTVVVPPPGNQSPVANAGADQSVTDSDGSGAETVTLNGSGSYDPDGTIVSYVWFEGGLEIANGLSPSVSFAVGSHTVTLEVTDDDGATATANQNITVNAPLDTMHLEDLSVKTRSGQRFWTMTVTASVRDANNGPIAGATVSYFWSDTPNNIHSDCFTDESGQCSVWGLQLRGNCMTFTVVDVSHHTLTYDAGQDKVNDISACK